MVVLKRKNVAVIEKQTLCPIWQAFERRWRRSCGVDDCWQTGRCCFRIIASACSYELIVYKFGYCAHMAGSKPWAASIVRLRAVACNLPTGRLQPRRPAHTFIPSENPQCAFGHFFV